MDIGEIDEIHFRNKQEVGRRMALWALAEVYEKPVAYAGPMYRSMSVEGDSIRIRFKNAESGLKTSDGQPPSEFVIAGETGDFFAADVATDGDSVVVNSKHVANPTAVRFAWSNIAIPNLINGDGLPASIFRTDQPGVEAR